MDKFSKYLQNKAFSIVKMFKTKKDIFADFYNKIFGVYGINFLDNSRKSRIIMWFWVVYYVPIISVCVYHVATSKNMSDCIGGIGFLFAFCIGGTKTFELTAKRDKILYVEKKLKKMFIEGKYSGFRIYLL